MKKIILIAALSLSLVACNEPQSKARAVYLLLDTSLVYFLLGETIEYVQVLLFRQIYRIQVVPTP